MLLDKLLRNALDKRDKYIYLSSSLSLPHHPLLWLTYEWQGSVTRNILSIHMWLITWKCERPYFMNTVLCTSLLSFRRQCLSYNAKILKEVRKWSSPQFAALLILKQCNTTMGTGCPTIQDKAGFAELCKRTNENWNIGKLKFSGTVLLQPKPFINIHALTVLLGQGLMGPVWSGTLGPQAGCREAQEEAGSPSGPSQK